MAKPPNRRHRRDALRFRGALHPHPERVRDPLFVEADFFDPEDLVQVKYEMLRRVQVEGQRITVTAATFGLSRPVFYEAQDAFGAQGMAGLLPKKRGPRRAHKLSDEILDFAVQQRSASPRPSTTEILDRIRERFGVAVHRRSLERALRRREKKLW